MTEEKPERKKSPWVLTAIVAVISIMIVLGIVLMVQSAGCERLRRQQECGKQQSQLLGALIAYQTVYDNAFPLSTHLKQGKGMTAHDARQMSYYILGTIAREQKIPFNFLSCPRSSLRSNKLALFEGPHPPAEWGMTDSPAVYAFDWSAPLDPPAARVVFADRDPTAHVDSIMACFGDTHVKNLKYASGSVRKSGALVTEGCEGKPVSINAFADSGDDIYSADGDGGDPLTAGAGDPLRAWVK